MMKQIPNLAQMRAFNGDYTVFTTTTGEQGIADRRSKQGRRKLSYQREGRTG